MLKCFILLVSAVCVDCLGNTIWRPKFESKWLPLVAQTDESTLNVKHGLKEVPVLVDVLVKALDGPNKGFVFKANGNSIRDDDLREQYGGVIYIYNNESVKVLAPNAYNDQRIGAAIYTGESPFWKGGQTQRSYRVEVKVRCWSKTDIAPPCFYINDIFMKASSGAENDTYKEIKYHTSGYPSLVKVRAKLTDGPVKDWYSDAQGTSLFNLGTMNTYCRTGGLIFSYNNESVRIWTSSYPNRDGVLFTAEDGWGYRKSIGSSSEGKIEIRVWCNLVNSLTLSASFGPTQTLEETKLVLPARPMPLDEQFYTVVVQVTNGPNKGYIFEGAGSAATHTVNPGQPCSFGGLVYAYNGTTLRFWYPANTAGAAVCIPDSFGYGINSQSANEGNIYLRIFEPIQPQPAEEYRPVLPMCSHIKV